MRDLGRRAASEALGTAFLVLAVVGSGIMATRLTDDVALALLANGITTGAILIVLITMLAPLSGAHLNPVVSLVFALRGELAPRDALVYGAAQITGGIAGTMLAHAMFELPLLATSTTMRTGVGQWLAEGTAAFGLVLTILLGLKTNRAAVPVLVGFFIASAYWFTASTSFANPAVTIARTLTESFAGIRPIDAPAFVAAQIAGALAAMIVARYLLGPSGRTCCARTFPNSIRRLGPIHTTGRDLTISRACLSR